MLYILPQYNNSNVSKWEFAIHNSTLIKMVIRIHAGKGITDEKIMKKLEKISFGILYQYYEYLQSSTSKMEDEETK